MIVGHTIPGTALAWAQRYRDTPADVRPSFDLAARILAEGSRRSFWNGAPSVGRHPRGGHKMHGYELS